MCILKGPFANKKTTGTAAGGRGKQKPQAEAPAVGFDSTGGHTGPRLYYTGRRAQYNDIERFDGLHFERTSFPFKG
jgi:hypothetical protein